jgi:hypothetical protein
VLPKVYRDLVEVAGAVRVARARGKRQNLVDGGLFSLGSKVRTGTNLKRKKSPVDPYALTSSCCR